MIGDGNFISQVPLFGGLDDAQQVSLQQKMGHTTLRRGETLFDEGDLGDRLYIVTEGKVKLGHTSSDGRESLLAVLGPGEIIGELTLFDPGPRSTTATAVSPASSSSGSRWSRTWTGRSTPRWRCPSSPSRKRARCWMKIPVRRAIISSAS